jgi:hypothetical protein
MTNSADTNTKSRVNDIPLSDEFKNEFGFIQARVVNGYLTLTHIQKGKIRCQFDIKNLSPSSKRLANAIASNENNVPLGKDFDTNKFIKKFIDLILDNIEHEHDEKKAQEKEEQDGRQKILDDISSIIEEQTKAQLTFSEWQQQQVQRYHNLKNIIQEKMPEIWLGLEYGLSIMQILKIQGCTLPFIGIILGRPSSYKTVIIELFRSYPNTFYTDNFTARSFVTHSTSVESEEELEQLDLIPKIRNRLFLTPELSPMFTTKDEDLTHLLGIITRLADGKGYSSDSGAHGHRGYDDDIMFTWLGAAVDIPYKVYKLLGNLGAKLYFFRTSFKNVSSEELMEYAMSTNEFNDKIRQIKNTLYNYLKWLDVGFNLFRTELIWDVENDSRKALEYIVRSSDLLSYLRCVAVTWETHDTQGLDYAYSVSQREVPRRAITVLLNLARGHALLEGRNYITMDDIPLILKTAFDTAQIEHVSMFSLMMSYGGVLTTTQVMESLNVSRPTALRTMAEFKAIELIDVEEYHEPGDPVIKKIFPHITPPDQNFSEGNGNGHGKKEDVFWEIYNELEAEESKNVDNIREVDKNTVSCSGLHERLLSTGEFSKANIVFLIGQLLATGRLEQPIVNTYRKIVA